MAIFVKRSGAPAGIITITTSQGTHVIDDSLNTTINVTDPQDIKNLLDHPFLQLQGGSTTYTPPPTIEQVFLKDGVLVASDGDTLTTIGGAIKHNGTVDTTPNFVDATAADLVAIGVPYALNPVWKTANYTAALNEFVLCDATGGSFTVIAPGNSNVSKARWGASLTNTAAGNTVTLQAGPGDVFDYPGGPTTKTLKVAGQRIEAQYYPSSAVWVITNHSISIDAADARYAAIGSGGGGGGLVVDAWAGGTVAETMRRPSAVNTAIALVSGAMKITGGATIPANKTATTLTAVAGGTAATAPTNQWMALYKKSDGTLISVTDDKTTAAWAANNPKSFTLATPYTPTTDTAVWVAILVAGTTPPSLVGANVPNAISGLSPVLGSQTGVGLTNPASAPTTIATPAPGAGGAPFYAAIS